MYCLVITGGNKPSIEIFKAILENVKVFKIICADSGFDYIYENGYEPDFVVGDFDSIKNLDALKKLEQSKIIPHNPDKDYSDTELALLKASEFSKDIILIGGGGGRLDHLLNIINIFKREFKPKFWIDDSNFVCFINDDFFLKTKKNQVFSIYPIDEFLKGSLKIENVKWSIEGISALGMSLSNVCFNGELVGVVGEGKYLFIFELSQNIVENIK